jgi:hypothetical protein
MGNSSVRGASMGCSPDHDRSTRRSALRFRRFLAVGLLALSGGISISPQAWSAPTSADKVKSGDKEAAGKETAGKETVIKELAGKDRKDDEGVRRSTAVTLNYCRASFYRIQKMPTLRVLVEEQEKILNNVDLNGIADQEVIKLYTGVLVEISEIRLSDRERVVLDDK